MKLNKLLILPVFIILMMGTSLAGFEQEEVVGHNVDIDTYEFGRVFIGSGTLKITDAEGVFIHKRVGRNFLTEVHRDVEELEVSGKHVFITIIGGDIEYSGKWTIWHRVD